MKNSIKLFGMTLILSIAGLAHSTPIQYYASLSGAAESPVNASPGTGFAVVTYDPVTHMMQVQVTFSGLQN